VPLMRQRLARQPWPTSIGRTQDARGMSQDRFYPVCPQFGARLVFAGCSRSCDTSQARPLATCPDRVPHQDRRYEHHSLRAVDRASLPGCQPNWRRAASISPSQETRCRCRRFIGGSVCKSFHTRPRQPELPHQEVTAGRPLPSHTRVSRGHNELNQHDGHCRVRAALPSR
jgi:hypothetical protein